MTITTRLSKQLIIFFPIVCIYFSSYSQTFIPSSDPHIQYQGRVDHQPAAAVLSWSGSSATICFKGRSLSAVIKDSDTANYYNVVLDNKVISKIHTDTSKKTYLLATGLKNKKHTLQLFKRTEWVMGKTSFYGFETPAKTKLYEPPPLPKRTIEFYGNSITCGYAIEDFTGKDRGIGHFEDNYKTYAAITARHFNAQYSCIARSGIGIMVSWFPQIMPEMYDRLNPSDPTSTWDFSQYTPDIVVVNLYQNDSWIVTRPENNEFKHRFGTEAPTGSFIIQSYQRFISSIRSKYPNANIICALGSMDATKEGSPWPGYVQEAVSHLKDPKIYTHFFPFNKTGLHPGIEDHKAMANSLIDFIDRNISW